MLYFVPVKHDGWQIDYGVGQVYVLHLLQAVPVKAGL